MKSPPDLPAPGAATSSSPAALRAGAEATYLKDSALDRNAVLASPTPDPASQLLHELRVHQIELEMQN